MRSHSFLYHKVLSPFLILEIFETVTSMKRFVHGDVCQCQIMLVLKSEFKR